MVKLLIIADDFTGALDTAIHFSGGARRTVVFLRPSIPWDSLPPETQVVVVNTDSRHLPAQEAYRLVAALAAEGRAHGVGILFKKIDSAFRGNPGSELQALLDCGGSTALFLLPAFPAGGRTTAGGIQLWNGVPIAETAYGKDPFSPVRSSCIREILHAQASSPVHNLAVSDPLPDAPAGILVFDAENETQMQARCRSILGREPALLGGCAGLSKALAAVLFPKPAAPQPTSPAARLLIVSGSLHTVSRAQMRAGRERGLPCHTLRLSQELAAGFPESPAGAAFIAGVQAELAAHGTVLLETSDEGAQADPAGRESVSARIAALTAAIYQAGAPMALAVFGGDTLLQITGLLMKDGIYPVAELEPGVPLSLATDRSERTVPVVSKSGGFGSEFVINQILEYFSIGGNSNG